MFGKNESVYLNDSGFQNKKYLINFKVISIKAFNFQFLFFSLYFPVSQNRLSIGILSSKYWKLIYNLEFSFLDFKCEILQQPTYPLVICYYICFHLAYWSLRSFRK